MKILIMGLPGSGKTTLAKSLAALLNGVHINADEVRSESNDWDFSQEGRIRQAKRMNDKATMHNEAYVILDFVAALKKQRDLVSADFVIWMDTLREGRYADTNAAFEPPVTEYNLRLISHDRYKLTDVAQLILDCVNEK